MFTESNEISKQSRIYSANLYLFNLELKLSNGLISLPISYIRHLQVVDTAYQMQR